jgi:hypothetical protein
MGLRDKMRRLEREAEGTIASFELLDGSRYYFDPISWEPFDHWHKCIGASSAHNWPEPPEVYKKLCEARDPERALEQVMGGMSFFVYDPEILITERRLEPRGLVSRYDPETKEHVVIDPYEEQPNRDLSDQAQHNGEDA